MKTMPIVSAPLLVLALAAGASAAELQPGNTAAPVAESSAAEQQPEGAAQQPSPSQPESKPKVDVDQLPLDLNRVQRQLQQSNERQDGSGLNLRFFIAVYAAAPPIQLFTQQDNLSRGPVPYGAPTHSDMMQITIPQEYRAPAADFSALTRWLASRAKKND